MKPEVDLDPTQSPATNIKKGNEKINPVRDLVSHPSNRLAKVQKSV